MSKPTRCECGVPCATGLSTCRRCWFMDGGTDSQRRIIAILQELGSATIVELMREMYPGLDYHDSYAQMLHRVKPLLRSGRLVVIELDDEPKRYALADHGDCQT